MMQTLKPRLLVAAAAVAAALAAVLPASGQAAGALAPSSATVSRAELESMLSHASEIAAGATAGPVREQARAEANLIRARLAAGDLRAGDQVALTVAGQPSLTGTFEVSAGRALTLPGVGEVALAGVLRSELPAHLAARLPPALQGAAVEAQVMIPVEIGGAVARPGTYTVRAGLPVADVLALAGGAGSADAERRARIRRGGDVIWQGHALRSAELMGLSLDQLSLRGGDRVEVPGGGGEGFGGSLRSGVLAVGAVASFLAVLVQTGIF